MQQPVELRAHDERHVSAREREAARGARVQRVAVRHDALPHRRGDERNSGPVHERADSVLRVRVRGALAEDDERALGVAEERDGGGDVGGGCGEGFAEPPRSVEGPNVDERVEEGGGL